MSGNNTFSVIALALVLIAHGFPAKSGGTSAELLIRNTRSTNSSLAMHLVLELDNPEWHPDCGPLVLELVAPTGFGRFLAFLTLNTNKHGMTSVALEKHLSEGFFETGKVLKIDFTGNIPGTTRVSQCHYISDSFSVWTAEYLDLLIKGQLDDCDHMNLPQCHE